MPLVIRDVLDRTNWVQFSASIQTAVRFVSTAA